MPTVINTAIPDVMIIVPDIHIDDRGSFFESHNHDDFRRIVGRNITFIQDNHSTSAKHVLRGLHYQLHTPQAKLIRVIRGEIYDVAVDVRRGSPSFGTWVGAVLSQSNRYQMWVPEGFAHGFITLSDTSEVLYKVSAPYHPHHERSIIWNDPDLAIDWPDEVAPLLSEKDKNAPRLEKADCFPATFI